MGTPIRGTKVSDTTPLYRRLAQDLRKAISQGHYPTGSLLPTEQDLCAQHKVSRHTARDALRILTDEGLIERRRGAGSVVIAAKPVGPFSQGWGEIGDILQYARDTRLVILTYGPATAEDVLAMGLDANQPWIGIKGLRMRAGSSKPLAHTSICVRKDLAPPHAALTDWPHAIAEYIARHNGVLAARIEQDISAVKLGRELAKALHEHAGEPALRTRRRYLDSEGVVFQASISVHPGEHFTYAMSVSR